MRSSRATGSGSRTGRASGASCDWRSRTSRPPICGTRGWSGTSMSRPTSEAPSRCRGRTGQGDWASSMNWIRQDKIFGGIPTGGTVDFAFADLTPETVIVGLSPRDFAANVHSGLFVGWAHHIVALVAERPVDRGRLMICTYRLRDHLGNHPVATIMMRDMIARVARPAARGREELATAIPQVG